MTGFFEAGLDNLKMLAEKKNPRERIDGQWR